MSENLPASYRTAAEYARGALSGATQRAYRSDWRHFVAWCRDAGLLALGATPETIAAYLASMARTHGRATLRRRLASIGQAHRFASLDWEVPAAVRATLRGIMRQHGQPARQAAALTSAEVKRMVAAAGEDARGIRDRAILLVGLAGALRRSEIVGIDREHLTHIPAGMVLLIPRSKSDQQGEGAELVIPHGRQRPTCPVRAVERWIEISHTEFGPLFRRIDRWGTIEHERLNGESVRRLVIRLAEAAGVTCAAHERISAHGLRAGFVTEAYRKGARDEDIMPHTRHRSIVSMRRYVRRAKAQSESPAKLLDL